MIHHANNLLKRQIKLGDKDPLNGARREAVTRILPFVLESEAFVLIALRKNKDGAVDGGCALCGAMPPEAAAQTIAALQQQLAEAIASQSPCSPVQ